MPQGQLKEAPPGEIVAPMDLKEEKDGWCLMLREGSVHLIQIDFRLGLFLSDPPDNATLFVETPCRLKSPDATVLLTPGRSSTLGPILPFFNANVVAVAVRCTGELRLTFGGDHSLEVDPDPNYEAWQLSTADVMLVCSPGGAISLFRKD